MVILIENKEEIIIEIIRKVKSDSFYGIIFQPNEELSFSKLEEIKYNLQKKKEEFSKLNSTYLDEIYEKTKKV